MGCGTPTGGHGAARNNDNNNNTYGNRGGGNRNNKLDVSALGLVGENFSMAIKIVMTGRGMRSSCDTHETHTSRMHGWDEHWWCRVHPPDVPVTI